MVVFVFCFGGDGKREAKCDSFYSVFVSVFRFGFFYKCVLLLVNVRITNMKMHVNGTVLLV